MALNIKSKEQSKSGKSTQTEPPEVIEMKVEDGKSSPEVQQQADETHAYSIGWFYRNWNVFAGSIRPAFPAAVGFADVL